MNFAADADAGVRWGWIGGTNPGFYDWCDGQPESTTPFTSMHGVVLQISQSYCWDDVLAVQAGFICERDLGIYNSIFIDLL